MEGLSNQAFFSVMTKDNWEIKLAGLICITAFIHGSLYLVGSMKVFMPPIPIDFTITCLFSIILFRMSSLQAIIGSSLSLIIAFSLFAFYARDQWISSFFFDEKSIINWENKSDIYSLIFSLGSIFLFAYYFMLSTTKRLKTLLAINALLLVFLIIIGQSPFYAILPTPLIFMTSLLQDEKYARNVKLPAVTLSVISCFLLFRFFLLLSHQAQFS